MTSRADAAENVNNMLSGQLYNTTESLDSAISRAKAAEQEVEKLKAQIHVVELFDVDQHQTEQIVRGDVEPAATRLKRLQEGSKQLQAQAAKAQVRVKQEKAAVVENLEDTQDDYQLQITFTDTLQAKFDEMAELVVQSFPI